MTAYCLWDVREIHDQDAIDEYVEKVTATVEAHGGEYVVIGDRGRSSKATGTPRSRSSSGSPAWRPPTAGTPPTTTAT